MLVVGLAGGLGNQMFMYAFARAQQLHSGEDTYLSQYSFIKSHQGHYCLDRCMDVASIEKLSDHPLLCIPVYIKRLVFEALLRLTKADRRDVSTVLKFAKRGYYYSRTPRFIAMPDVRTPIKYCYGYFQSEQYFRDYSQIIRDELRIKEVSEDCNHYANGISETESVCVHVRRGDYLGQDYYNVCGEDYYHSAITQIREMVNNPIFFFFSNDIDWVKERFRSPDFCYVDRGFEDYEDLYLMYHCKHFIISNSSFSWWAQYLCDNDDKVVIAPERWCNGDDSSIRDIYCDDWTLITSNGEGEVSC